MGPHCAQAPTRSAQDSKEDAADMPLDSEAESAPLIGGERSAMSPPPPPPSAIVATDEYKERMEKMMAELPFEVRAILDDDLAGYPIPAPLDPVPQKQLCCFLTPARDGHHSCCGVGLQRCAFIMAGMVLGMILAATLMAAIAAFVIPESVWTGGVCEHGWLQHMGDCYKPGPAVAPSAAAGKNYSAGETFADAKISCAAVGGNIVSSDKALRFIALLGKTASGPESAPLRGSWWAMHSDSCAVVHYAPGAAFGVHRNASSRAPAKLHSEGTLDVIITESAQCSGLAGVMCTTTPMPPIVSRYTQALRAVLTLGIYAE